MNEVKPHSTTQGKISAENVCSELNSVCLGTVGGRGRIHTSAVVLQPLLIVLVQRIDKVCHTKYPQNQVSDYVTKKRSKVGKRI